MQETTKNEFPPPSVSLRREAEQLFRFLGFRTAVRISDIQKHFQISRTRIYRAVAMGEIAMAGKGCVDAVSLLKWMTANPRYLCTVKA